MPKRRAVPREYDEVWREVYLSGTEWDQLELVDSIEWDFSHLDAALNDPLGILTHFQLPHLPTPEYLVHLFGSTEPQLVSTDSNPNGQVIPIPVIIAIISTRAPPSTLGIKSVQRTEEEVLPMKDLRMGWFPVLAANELISGVRRSSPNVFALKCEQRRVGLKNISEEKVKKFDYVLPYIVFPKDNNEDEVVDTVVNVMADLPNADGTNGKPLVFEYDWEMDDLDDFVKEKCDDEELDESKVGDMLRDQIKSAVKAEKLKNKAEREAKAKVFQDMDPKEVESLKTMKLLKFYPANSNPDLSEFKTKYINRYYGHAHTLI